MGYNGHSLYKQLFLFCFVLLRPEYRDICVQISLCQYTNIQTCKLCVQLTSVRVKIQTCAGDVVSCRVQKPGYSTEMKVESLAEYEYPAGSAWQALFAQGLYERPQDEQLVL